MQGLSVTGTCSRAASVPAGIPVCPRAVRATSVRPNSRTPVCGVVRSAIKGQEQKLRSVRAMSTSASAAASPDVETPIARGSDGLIVPHGGELVDLMLPAQEREAAIKSCTKTLELSDRAACDVELLVNGGFSPLTGFLDEAAYRSVVDQSTLPNGLAWTLPVVLDVGSGLQSLSPKAAPFASALDSAKFGDRVLLTYQGADVAVLTVQSIFAPDRVVEAAQCYGTTSLEHPAVRTLAFERSGVYVGGPLEGLGAPRRPFPCATPREVRASLPPHAHVLAFQCRNPIHRAHYELFTRALSAPGVDAGAVCLVHPTMGPTQGEDIPGDVRYRTYVALEKEIADARLRWAYLPYSMHMAGPREAVQHMIVRKNYGCTHFIIGRDMAGCKSCLTGKDFYAVYDAQNAAKDAAPGLGMRTAPSLDISYTVERGFVTSDVAHAEKLHTLSLSGTQFRKMLVSGDDIPEWFSFASVIEVLRRAQKKP